MVIIVTVPGNLYVNLSSYVGSNKHGDGAKLRLTTSLRLQSVYITTGVPDKAKYIPCPSTTPWRGMREAITSSTLVSTTALELDDWSVSRSCRLTCAKITLITLYTEGGWDTYDLLHG